MQLISWRFFFRAIIEDLPLDEIVDELRDFDDRFSIIIRKHLAALGWWCILHLLVSLPGLSLADGALWYFFLMNMTWALINFTVVLWIYDHTLFKRFAPGNSLQRFEVQRHVEKMLLLNIGLDVAYVFAGLYLQAVSYRPGKAYPELWMGFGWSVILQGVYLLFQDNFFHRLHQINFRKARSFLEKVLEDYIAPSSSPPPSG